MAISKIETNSIASGQTITSPTLVTPTITTPNTTGVTNGSNAATGYVGEYLDISTTFISVSTGTNLASLTLTAGDWDISGAVQLYSGGGTNAVYAAINTTSGSVTGVYGQNYVLAATYNAGGVGVANISRYRVNITSTTTYYLNASVSGTANNCLGFMSARRMR